MTLSRAWNPSARLPRIFSNRLTLQGDFFSRLIATPTSHHGWSIQLARPRCSKVAQAEPDIKNANTKVLAHFEEAEKLLMDVKHPKTAAGNHRRNIAATET